MLLKADVYIAGTDPLHIWGLTRRQSATIEGGEIFFAPPEYVVLRKLQCYRESHSTKHLRDIHRMVHVLGADWDNRDLLNWVAESGLWTEWEAALHCLDGLQ